MIEVQISTKEAGQRIDKFVRRYLNEAPLSFLYRLFRLKDIKVNTKPVPISYILKEKDCVRIYITEQQLKEFAQPKEFIRGSGLIQVLYEDDNVLIVEKPRGILVHGDEKEKRRTLSNQVLNYLVNKGEYDPASTNRFVPSPAHRLDRNTSGIVLFGKNIEALQELFSLFKKREGIKKEYLALLEGQLRKEGEINLPLMKDEKKGMVSVSSLNEGGKSAITRYTIQEVFKDKTLVQATLITGRSHQLRVHFASIHHPICGDSKYGDFYKNHLFEKKYQFHDQFLHAFRLTFLKIEGKLSYLSNKTFTMELPKEEQKILEELRKEKACI